jgi:hypothetical protein
MRVTATTGFSSLYEIPTDKPINLDISKFMQADSLAPKLDDADIIAEALK